MSQIEKHMEQLAKWCSDRAAAQSKLLGDLTEKVIELKDRVRELERSYEHDSERRAGDDM